MTKAEREEAKRLKEIAEYAASEICYLVRLNRTNLKITAISRIVESAINSALEKTETTPNDTESLD